MRLRSGRVGVLCLDVGERKICCGPWQVLERQVTLDNVEAHDRAAGERDVSVRALCLDRIEGLRVDVRIARLTRAIGTVRRWIDADTFDGPPVERRLAFVMRGSGADGVAKPRHGV